MQLQYNRYMDAGFPGMLGNSGFKHTDSMVATEEMLPGDGLVRVAGSADKVRLPNANQCVLTDSGGTYTAGDSVVVINGITVTQAWGTSKDATLTALAVALQALAAVATAVYSNTAHTITITAASEDTLVVSIDFSGITGTMTVTQAYACADTFYGVAQHEAGIEQSGSGTVMELDQAVCTLSGDALTTSDTVQATVNGTTLDAITYTTSEAVTLGLLAQQIQARPGIKTATVAGRVLTVLSNEGLPLTVNSIVVDDDTLGAVAPSFAIAHSSQNSAGVGLTKLLPTRTVNALRKGSIYVYVEEAVTVDDTPYVRFVDSGTYRRGHWRKSADSATCVAVSGARFKTNAAAGAVALVEINLP